MGRTCGWGKGKEGQKGSQQQCTEWGGGVGGWGWGVGCVSMGGGTVMNTHIVHVHVI